VPAETRARIGEAIEEQLAAGCPGVILEIDAPRLGVVMREARGVFARGEARPLLVGDGFRAASVTKAATAAVAVGLAARGRWRLDDSVATYLPADLIEKLSRLDGLEDSGELTIRRLLAHSSGVPDYFFDPGFQSRVERDPDRRWRPQELFAAAMSVGRLLFPPGSDFAYGDSAYVMVGLAIEQLLGVRLSDAFRSVVFEPLAMEATYLEFHETPRGCELSHHYRGDEDLHGRNLSFDWSGGGLVTTAADLSAFLRGLFGGVLFERRWLD
jgi:D-alanyl-D-alanine carboxypeptidase